MPPARRRTEKSPGPCCAPQRCFKGGVLAGVPAVRLQDLLQPQLPLPAELRGPEQRYGQVPAGVLGAGSGMAGQRDVESPVCHSSSALLGSQALDGWQLGGFCPAGKFLPIECLQLRTSPP